MNLRSWAVFDEAVRRGWE